MLCHKFKALRHALKIWSKHFSRLSIAITNYNEVLAELDELENKQCLRTLETNFINILKAHLIRLLKYQKLYWEKCCTIRWIKFGMRTPGSFKLLPHKDFVRTTLPHSALMTINGLMITLVKKHSYSPHTKPDWGPLRNVI